MAKIKPQRNWLLALCAILGASPAMSDDLRDAGYGDGSLIDSQGYSYFPQPDGSYVDAYGNAYAPNPSGDYTDALGNVLSPPDADDPSDLYSPAWSNSDEFYGAEEGRESGKATRKTTRLPSDSDGADNPGEDLAFDRPGTMYLEDAGSPYLETEPVAILPDRPSNGAVDDDRSDSANGSAAADAADWAVRPRQGSGYSTQTRRLATPSDAPGAPTVDQALRERVHLNPVGVETRPNPFKPFPPSSRN